MMAKSFLSNILPEEPMEIEAAETLLEFSRKCYECYNESLMSPTGTLTSAPLDLSIGRQTQPLFEAGARNSSGFPFQSGRRMTKVEKQAIRSKMELIKDTSRHVVVEGYLFPREIWAKAFLKKTYLDTAAVLYGWIFSEQELRQCTLSLSGINTTLLLLKKKEIIFRILSWMKNKNKDPYSFNYHTTLNELSEDEKTLILSKIYRSKKHQLKKKLN